MTGNDDVPRYFPVALCVCGHADDHAEKPCSKSDRTGALCGCTFGTRTALAIARMVDRQGAILSQISMTLMRLLAIAEATSNLGTRIVTDKDTGRTRVEIEQRPPAMPGLIIPR